MNRRLKHTVHRILTVTCRAYQGTNHWGKKQYKIRYDRKKVVALSAMYRFYCNIDYWIYTKLF